MSNYAKLIEKRFKPIFERSGQTQEEWAENTGLRQADISLALNGKMANPTIKTLAALAKACGKPAGWLLQDVSDPTTPSELSITQALEAVAAGLKEKVFITADPDLVDRMVKIRRLKESTPAILRAIDRVIAPAEAAEKKSAKDPGKKTIA